jgi:lipopolysaccharide transport system ATP-binding protein
MSNVAIRVENLSKRYRIGVRQEKYRTLRDAIVDVALTPVRRLRSRFGARRERIAEQNTIWALNGVSFEVPRGEVVGVIGRNGAGKSTLLKILSRITEPTAGSAEIHGRVGSLLEVGTGFHPELTGRENIFLNGAILGMRRSEIDRQFEEIVAFAEVEKFIDTPVKHYSSGMYLRLAFAVAAHMEPEILMVDEVLAVGDAAFQKKCLGKVGEIASQGRTVFFVSHNLGVVRELCTSSLILHNGRLDFQGPVNEGVARYSRRASDPEMGEASRGTGWRSVEVLGRPGGRAETSGGDRISVQANLELLDDFASARVILLVENALGDTVIHAATRSSRLAAGIHQIHAVIPPLPLAPSVYTAYLKFFGDNSSGLMERHLSDRVAFEVNGSVQDLGRAVLAPPCEWEISRVRAHSSRLTPAGAD